MHIHPNFLDSLTNVIYTYIQSYATASPLSPEIRTTNFLLPVGYSQSFFITIFLRTQVSQTRIGKSFRKQKILHRTHLIHKLLILPRKKIIRCSHKIQT